MAMEYMDLRHVSTKVLFGILLTFFPRSLDQIAKLGPFRVDVLGKITVAIVGGLKYLYTEHRIVHRDLNPSNILVNSSGQIKLYNFGFSSQLLDSVADTFVGTGTYMAPERIQGNNYTIKSDVWSVGLTVFELAVGEFPYHKESTDESEASDILELLQEIVYEPSPKLPKSDAFPEILGEMIDKCLMKNPKERPYPHELFVCDWRSKQAHSLS